MSLEIGTPAPHFTLPNQQGEKVSLADLTGSKALLVFIPYAFTRVCQSELCQIRDNTAMFGEAGVRVAAITCNTVHANRAWAQQNGFEFDLLSDFWPHGEVARLYDSFNEAYGYATRTTYVLDPEGVIRHVVRSDELGVARPFEAYAQALQGI